MYPSMSYSTSTTPETLHPVSLTRNELRRLILDILKEEKDLRKSERKALVKKLLNTGILVSGLTGFVGTSTSNNTKTYDIGTHPIVQERTVIIPEQVTKPKPVASKSVSQNVNGVVHFSSGHFRLTPKHKERLNHIIHQLPKNATLIIVGHTDMVGNIEHNIVLGHKRANVVADYFKQHGVNVTNVNSLGSKFLVEKTNTSSWQNRRVDIVINNIDSKLKIQLPKEYSYVKPVVKKVKQPEVISPVEPLDHNDSKNWELTPKNDVYTLSPKEQVLKKIGKNKQGQELFYDGNDTIVIKSPTVK